MQYSTDKMCKVTYQEQRSTILLVDYFVTHALCSWGHAVKDHLVGRRQAGHQGRRSKHSKEDVLNHYIA